MYVYSAASSFSVLKCCCPDIEYSSIAWGDETVTLLCPMGGGGAGGGAGGEEPYVMVSEMVQKVFHHRSYVSVEQRNKLGVALLPASSLQIHALRARGAVDSSAGMSSKWAWHIIVVGVAVGGVSVHLAEICLPVYRFVYWFTLKFTCYPHLFTDLFT